MRKALEACSSALSNHKQECMDRAANVATENQGPFSQNIAQFKSENVKRIHAYATSPVDLRGKCVILL